VRTKIERVKNVPLSKCEPGNITHSADRHVGRTYAVLDGIEHPSRRAVTVSTTFVDTRLDAAVPFARENRPVRRLPSKSTRFSRASRRIRCPRNAFDDEMKSFFSFFRIRRYPRPRRPHLFEYTQPSNYLTVYDVQYVLGIFELHNRIRALYNRFSFLS